MLGGNDALMALPDSTRIGRVTLQVGDLDRSLQFYRDVIGFRELARHDRPAGRVATLGAAGSTVVWLELREKRGVRRQPARGLIGLYHFAVLLPSQGHLGRFLVHAVNAGARVASADHLVSEALYLTDPDGLTVEVYRDRPRSEWRRSGGELRMASLPLDADAVVSAAASAPDWRGLPEGTTIGHVHFYVGDLAEAEAFYHAGLGFDPVLRSFPGALFVSAGGYHHHVGLNTWAANMPVASDADARLLWWELRLPDAVDVSTVAGRLERAGYGVTAHDGVNTATDPWGIEVRITSETDANQ